MLRIITLSIQQKKKSTLEIKLSAYAVKYDEHLDLKVHSNGIPNLGLPNG